MLRAGTTSKKVQSICNRITVQDRQCTYNATLGSVRESLLPWRSDKYHILVRVCAGGGGCVRVVAQARGCARVALLIQQEKRMHHIVSYVASLAQPHFSTWSHKQHDFRGKKLLNIKCVTIFSTTLVWNISHYKKNLAIHCHECENVFM